MITHLVKLLGGLGPPLAERDSVTRSAYRYSEVLLSTRVLPLGAVPALLAEMRGHFRCFTESTNLHAQALMTQGPSCTLDIFNFAFCVFKQVYTTITLT